MERNVDKIKRLEHELGRYQKKVADQAKEEAKLREQINDAFDAEIERHAQMNAILAVIAQKYGEDALDPDDETVVLGKRLVLPYFSIKDAQKKYEVRSRRDEEMREYVIGVVERQEAQET